MAEENEIEEGNEENIPDVEKKRIQRNTHLKIDQGLCGHIIDLDIGYAKVELETTREMAADELGLVHGGFTFGAADFAAMSAVNEPNVVLVSSENRFLAPVKVGDKVIFEAKELYQEARKRKIHVIGTFEDIKVFEGDFMAVVLDRHVLKLKLLKDKEA